MLRSPVSHFDRKERAIPMRTDTSCCVNPVHLEEDFSERWDSCPGAYLAFNDGIRRFASAWREVCDSRNNPGRLAKGVFGEVIDEAILLEARAMQADRSSSLLGIAPSGRIVPVAAAVTPMIRNTNYGKC